MNSNQMMNRAMAGQAMSMGNSFVQQQQQSSNNGMMSNQMIHSQQMGAQSGQMIHQMNAGVSNNNQRMNVQQAQQKTPNIDNRKQKMQFTQQPLQANKRFVSANQNPQIQLQPTFSNQPPPPNYNPAQQRSANSPQAQQVFHLFCFFPIFIIQWAQKLYRL